MNPLPRRPHGLALLEFALGVAVAGVLLALALNALSGLQLLGDEARRVTLASKQAAASSTQALRCGLQTAVPGAPAAPASRSCP